MGRAAVWYRRGMVARAWLIDAFGLLTSCAFFLDTGSLSGGARPAGDAGPDAPAPTMDAGAPLDADVDADAAPLPRFCARAPHTFCADFDGSTLDEGFTDKQEELGGALSRVTWPGLDGSQSLLATMPRRATAKGYASISVRSGGAWRRQHVEADLYVEPPAFEAGDSNFGIFCVGYYLGATEDGACISVGANYFTLAKDSSTPFPTGRWVHAVMDFDPGARRVTGKVDTIELDGTFGTPTSGGAPSSVFQIGVLGYNAPSPEARVHIDNFTVDDL